jgi:hypothetical protein
VVIRRAGAVVWWLAVLVGHVGSALLSDGARAAADDPDFGISCVLGATLGALFASGFRVIGAISFLLLLPFSLDWYGPEHPLSFALGAAVAASRRAGRSAGSGSAPRTSRARESCGA